MPLGDSCLILKNDYFLVYGLEIELCANLFAALYYLSVDKDIFIENMRIFTREIAMMGDLINNRRNFYIRVGNNYPHLNTFERECDIIKSCLRSRFYSDITVESRDDGVSLKDAPVLYLLMNVDNVTDLEFIWLCKTPLDKIIVRYDELLKKIETIADEMIKDYLNEK